MRILVFILLFLQGCVVLEINGTTNGESNFSIDTTQNLEKIQKTWCLDSNIPGTVGYDKINRVISQAISLELSEEKYRYLPLEYYKFKPSHRDIDVFLKNNDCYFDIFASGKILTTDKDYDVFAYINIIYEISFEQKEILFYGYVEELSMY